ncbi:MAG: protein kinase [Lentisphaeraceae bacterium]|nr:protein kinase [Lentisphaeraceae bacterium]
MRYSKSLLSLYDQAPDYQPDADELAPLTSELELMETTYSDSELIATGGMKAIYKVFNTKCQRHVAMATLLEGHSSECYDPFICEARLTALLEHPNIIKVYDVGTLESGVPFFTMELKNGNTLSQVLKRLAEGNQDYSRQYPLNTLLNIFIKICDAVAYAHSHNILHLDLKPANIQVGTFGEVLVCDWGLGKIISHPDEDPISASFTANILNGGTLYGEIKGTPGYMAPEQLKSAEKSRQTDIYSLGALLLSILVPARLKGYSQEKLLSECRNGVPHILNQKSLPISKSLRAVIRQAMHKDPAGRYASVAALRDEVEQHLAGYPTEAEKAGLLSQFRFLWNRNRRICRLITSFILLIICGLSFFISAIKRSERHALDARDTAREISAKLKLARDAAQKSATDLQSALQVTLQQESSLKQLPKNIIESVNKHKRTRNLRKFQLRLTPYISIRRSNMELRALLKVYPNSPHINQTLFYNYFIMMDFEAAEKLMDKSSAWFTKEINTIRKRFIGRGHGNKFAVFKDMVDYALQNEPPVLGEIIIAQHADKFRGHKDFVKLIHYLIKSYYPASANSSFLLKNKTLTLNAPKLNKLISPGSRLCLLRYLHLKKLIIVESSIRDAKQFKGLPLIYLDISGTQITNITPLKALPVLDHLHVRSGQIPRINPSATSFGITYQSK